MTNELYGRTPTVTGVCPRGSTIVVAAYHRLTAAADAKARIERQSLDVRKRVIGRWDARLWADGHATKKANMCSAYSLTGRVLRTESVDAGWCITLFGDGGQPLERWDGRRAHRRTVYDDQVRPVSVSERIGDAPMHCVERFAYGDSSESAKNRCGRMVREDDTGGSHTFVGYGLLGHTLFQARHFLADLDMPDWPESIPARDALLEVDHQGATMPYGTHCQYDALDMLLSQVDAVGNEQLRRYDVAGELRQMGLKAPDEADATNDFHTMEYDAFGHLRSQVADNGVTLAATYSDVDGRLQALLAMRSDKALQASRYRYDPVGNVVSITDDAQPTDWFNGEQVEPVSEYRYDTLYQLVQASGRESVQAGIRPGLPTPALPGGGDVNRRRNYTQSYTYDDGGNLLMLEHTQTATRLMRVDTRSNRSLHMPDASRPPDFAGAFDANGNLLKLEGAQAMSWNARNQLSRVTQVSRKDGTNDDEVYVYGADGRRCRKVRVALAKAIQHGAEVRYLPGLEIRTDTSTGEVLHVAILQAEGVALRRLHWHKGRDATRSQQRRYSVRDHLGSSMLELGDTGNVITHEGYYPYGGTAWWASISNLDANYKSVRYSGKERDATGLYEYGFRYYAPWLQRWINPDPAGDLDGLNLYGFVAARPVSLVDLDGRIASEDEDDHRPHAVSDERSPTWERWRIDDAVRKLLGFSLAEMGSSRDIFTETVMPVDLTERVQWPADPWRIFELQQDDASQYYLTPNRALPTLAEGESHSPLGKDEPYPPEAEGRFLFVIRAREPSRVYVGAAVDSHIGLKHPELIVEGHTSLARRAPVHFAGQIQFKKGQLIQWDNDSGHYKPDAGLHLRNLFTTARRLLPAERFVSGRAPETPDDWGF